MEASQLWDSFKRTEVRTCLLLSRAGKCRTSMTKPPSPMNLVTTIGMFHAGCLGACSEMGFITIGDCNMTIWPWTWILFFRKILNFQNWKITSFEFGKMSSFEISQVLNSEKFQKYIHVHKRFNLFMFYPDGQCAHKRRWTWLRSCGGKSTLRFVQAHWS